jgi:hypothetical protein
MSICIQIEVFDHNISHKNDNNDPFHPLVGYLLRVPSASISYLLLNQHWGEEVKTDA